MVTSPDPFPTICCDCATCWCSDEDFYSNCIIIGRYEEILHSEEDEEKNMQIPSARKNKASSSSVAAETKSTPRKKLTTRLQPPPAHSSPPVMSVTLDGGCSSGGGGNQANGESGVCNGSDTVVSSHAVLSCKPVYRRRGMPHLQPAGTGIASADGSTQWDAIDTQVRTRPFDRLLQYFLLNLFTYRKVAC